MVVLRTHAAGRLVKRVADEEVRAGEDQFRGVLREARLAADGALPLRHRLVPVAGDIEILAQIAQPMRMRRQLLQHTQQRLRVQRRQARPPRRRSRSVVQRGAIRQRCRVHAHNSVRMAGRRPPALILDAQHFPAPVMLQASVRHA